VSKSVNILIERHSRERIRLTVQKYHNTVNLSTAR